MIRTLFLLALLLGPVSARAQVPKAYNPDQECQAGNLVAMPAQGRWLMALVVAVGATDDPNLPCQVHPLGFEERAVFPFASSDLAAFFAATEPLGGHLPDAYFVRIARQLAASQQQPLAEAPLPFPKLEPLVQPQAAPRPQAQGHAPLPGLYECYALTSGHLSPRLALNLTIVDGASYRDYQGGAGQYTIDGAGTITFVGAALNGQRARYSQPSTPPTRNRPPNITYVVSGDSCDLKL